MNYFCPIPEVIEELKKGSMLVVVDSPSRENQGDIIFPAETVTVEKANFLMKECRGMFCAPITKDKAGKLDLPLMVPPNENTEKLKCNFTLTVDAKEVQSFGISASDRAMTVKLLASPSTKPGDLIRPGHVFPIVAADGGILERDGVLCEIIRDDGKVARLPDLVKFSKKFHLKLVSIVDLIKYIKKQPKSTQIQRSNTVDKVASSILPTEYGMFRVIIYRSLLDNREHAVLHMGNDPNEPLLTRIHSQCLTGDTFLSLKCECRQQLHQSMKLISKKKQGAIVYLNQEGRGIGLTNKIKAYALQDKGLDTVEANHALGFPADVRDYKVAADILHDLGIKEINLLTNNPDKVKQLSHLGIKIVKTIPLEIPPNGINKRYLIAKRKKLGHRLNL